MVSHSAGNVCLLARIESQLSPDGFSESQLVFGDIDGDHASPKCSRDHDRREPDTTAAVHGDPLTFGNAGLIHYCAKRSGETAPEACGGLESQLIRQSDQIEVRSRDRYVLREGAPVREARLELVIAHLLIARAAGPARATGADKRYGDAIAHVPSG